MRSLVSLTVTLLVRILRYLDQDSLVSVSQVCTFLWKVSSDPVLWSQCLVSPRRLATGPQLTQLLSLSRYSLLATLDLAHLKSLFIDQTVISLFLKYLRSNSKLRQLVLTNVDMSLVPAFPLSSGLTHVTTLAMSNCRLTTEQLNSILGKCCRGKYTKNVDLSFNDFTYTNHELLSSSILTLHSLNLSYTDLSSHQTETVLEAVKSSTIHSLDLSGNDLSLSKLDNIALNQNLTSLKMSETVLDPDNISTMFTNLQLVHHLRELRMDGTALSSVDPVLLSDAVVRVDTVHLNYCWLYCDHIEFILDAVNTDTRLRHLNLSGNHFEDVNVDLLMNALHYIDTLEMEWANLTEEHVSALVSDTEDLKPSNKIVLNHFEIIENFLDLHRKAKIHPNISLNIVRG